MASEQEQQTELIGLPELSEPEPMFASSGASITLPSDNRYPMMKWLAILLLVTALLGFANGLDYIDGDSGLVNHRRFIYQDAQRAAAGTAILQGSVVYEDGNPAPNHIVKVTVKRDDGVVFERENTTDSNGRFQIEELDPGVQVLLIANGSGQTQLVQHLVLLNPPPAYTIEPYGFTTLRLTFPSEETFERESTDGVFLNYVPQQAENETELYDESAAGMYVMIGVGFSGLALISIAVTWFGWRGNNRAILRTAAILAFFSQGPYGSACCFGLLAFGLTFALPKPRD